MTIYIHCDGSCYNHPDHNTVGYAAVLSKKEDPEMTEVIKTKTGWCEEGTNNIAEWLALLAGMEMMIEYHNEKPSPYTQYKIYTDSALIVGQANGTMKVRKNELKYYYAEYRALEQKAHEIWFDIAWVSRKQNRAADAYSKLVNPYFKEKFKNEHNNRKTV
jgi:ribonuclease HI